MRACHTPSRNIMASPGAEGAVKVAAPVGLADGLGLGLGLGLVGLGLGLGLASALNLQNTL